MAASGRERGGPAPEEGDSGGSRPHPAAHFYGGQAVLEGVMMRGRDHWAVAVRQPDGAIHVESHEIASQRRFPWLTWPGVRGVTALWQAMTIGARALAVSANRSQAEEQQLTPRQMGVSMAIAFVVFAAVFVVGPFLGFRMLSGSVSSSLVRNLLEGLGRVALFLAYIALIGRMKEIRRVFQYHGAEHKTIAAYEHGDTLAVPAVDRYSTLHVRCGTNFLLIVMLLAIIVYAVFPAHGLLAGILSRLIAIPVIAALSFEALRLGARFEGSPPMRALMAPGLWLQKITTRQPDEPQIEVAIASFREVLRRESGESNGQAAPPS